MLKSFIGLMDQWKGMRKLELAYFLDEVVGGLRRPVRTRRRRGLELPGDSLYGSSAPGWLPMTFQDMKPEGARYQDLGRFRQNDRLQVPAKI